MKQHIEKWSVLRIDIPRISTKTSFGKVIRHMIDFGPMENTK